MKSLTKKELKKARKLKHKDATNGLCAANTRNAANAAIEGIKENIKQDEEIKRAYEDPDFVFPPGTNRKHEVQMLDLEITKLHKSLSKFERMHNATDNRRKQ